MNINSETYKFIAKRAEKRGYDEPLKTKYVETRYITEKKAGIRSNVVNGSAALALAGVIAKKVISSPNPDKKLTLGRTIKTQFKPFNKIMDNSMNIIDKQYDNMFKQGLPAKKKIVAGGKFLLESVAVIFKGLFGLIKSTPKVIAIPAATLIGANIIKTIADRSKLNKEFDAKQTELDQFRGAGI